MAHFIPEECDVNGHQPSELLVYDELKKYLSEEWVVFHSFDYVRHDPAGQLWDGEIDFLLYHERKGFLVIEVKGGTITYTNGKWLQNGNSIDPVEQAKHNKFAVKQLLEEALGHNVPLRFAHAVCFPSCDKNATIWPPEAKGLVLTLSDLPKIETIASHLIETAPLPEDVCGTIDPEQVLDILSPIFTYKQKFNERVIDDAYFLKKLTERQDAILDALQNFPKLIIEGGAGTGKTVLAIKKAKMDADNGHRVLLLCFNEMLAKKIQKEIGGYYRECIKVGAFFEYCVETMNIPRADYEQYSDNPLLYSKVLPERIAKYFNCYPKQKYDTIIVDEGQDFTREIWNVIPQMLAPNGICYVFYDPDQNIFRDTLNLPDFGLPKVLLTKNCRNTKKIFEALAPYRTVKMELLEHTPEGSDVTIHNESTPDILAEELNKLMDEDHVNPNEITVIGGHSLQNTSLRGGWAGKYCIKEQPQQLAKKEIAYYTYMKFKGCESKVVILVDVDEDDPRWNRTGLYTAMSRAMHKLIILKKKK